MPEPTRPGPDTWAAMIERHRTVALTREPTVGPPEHRPEVAILACADARVTPSLLFDQPQGSAFVVRVAGNSATPEAVAGLTYAVEALGVGLIVVLGHTACGAVSAALAGSADPSLRPILDPIDAALASHARRTPGADGPGDLDAAVAANAAHNAERLRGDDGPLGAAIAAGRTTVRAAVHDLATGRLTDLGAGDGPLRAPS